jgi:hypothetical protein
MHQLSGQQSQQWEPEQQERELGYPIQHGHPGHYHPQQYHHYHHYHHYHYYHPHHMYNY